MTKKWDDANAKVKADIDAFDNEDGEFLKSAVALGGEWDVPPIIALGVAAVQLEAAADGCETWDAALKWAIDRGYIETDSNPFSGGKFKWKLTMSWWDHLLDTDYAAVDAMIDGDGGSTSELE